MNSLKTVSVFEALPDDVVERISSRCNWLKYQEHEMIIDFEDEMGSVYFIVSGKVRVTVRSEGGKEIILTEIGEGTTFGELSAIDGETRSACVVALQNTQVAAMSVRVFMDSLIEYPELSVEFLKLLSTRLRALNMRLSEYSFLDAKHRLYNELLRLSRPRAANPSQRIVTPPPLQKELADRIGCRREVVSRELSKLKKEEIVDPQRGGLVLTKPDELSKRISAAWER